MCRVFERQFALDDDPHRADILGLRADKEREQRLAAERASRLMWIRSVVRCVALALVMGLLAVLVRRAVVGPHYLDQQAPALQRFQQKEELLLIAIGTWPLGEAACEIWSRCRSRRKRLHRRSELACRDR